MTISIKPDLWPSKAGRACPGSRGLRCFNGGIYCWIRPILCGLNISLFITCNIPVNYILTFNSSNSCLVVLLEVISSKDIMRHDWGKEGAGYWITRYSSPTFVGVLKGTTKVLNRKSKTKKINKKGKHQNHWNKTKNKKKIFLRSKNNEWKQFQSTQIIKNYNCQQRLPIGFLYCLHLCRTFCLFRF